MNGAFETKYVDWINGHLARRGGERRRRLEEGHKHAEKLFLEKVWYPAVGTFDGLHPEYEVADFREGYRFLDFAYIRPPLKLAVEIDGFGPHSSKISRWQFSDSLMRQNELVLDGWKVLRFSYDDVNEKPRICERMILQMLSITASASGDRSQRSAEAILEREVVQIALGMERLLRPKDVEQQLDVGYKMSRRILQSLVRKQLLLPAGQGARRIRCYRVNRERAAEYWRV